MVLPDRVFDLPLPFAAGVLGAVTLSEGPGISSCGALARPRDLAFGFGSCGVSSISVEIVLVLARAIAFGTGTYSDSFVADRGRRLGVAFATAVDGPGICSPLLCALRCVREARLARSAQASLGRAPFACGACRRELGDMRALCLGFAWARASEQ